MFQRWEDLLFLHWKVSAELIQSTLPAGISVDTFAGDAYIGVVPFFMQAIRPAYLPPLPYISYFQELNVRTYVIDQQGKPGVWFYSLDANRALAVLVARNIFHLNYQLAKMEARREKLITYSALRVGQAIPAEFNYQPLEITAEPDPKSLESFLLDRYYLYAFNQKKSQLIEGRVWHEPYKIRKVAVTKWSAAPILWNGFGQFDREPDHICMSNNLDVQIFKPKMRDAISLSSSLSQL